MHFLDARRQELQLASPDKLDGDRLLCVHSPSDRRDCGHEYKSLLFSFNESLPRSSSDSPTF